MKRTVRLFATLLFATAAFGGMLAAHSPVTADDTTWGAPSGDDTTWGVAPTQDDWDTPGGDTTDGDTTWG